MGRPLANSPRAPGLRVFVYAPRIHSVLSAGWLVQSGLGRFLIVPEGFSAVLGQLARWFCSFVSGAQCNMYYYIAPYSRIRLPQRAMRNVSPAQDADAGATHNPRPSHHLTGPASVGSCIARLVLLHKETRVGRGSCIRASAGVGTSGEGDTHAPTIRRKPSKHRVLRIHTWAALRSRLLTPILKSYGTRGLHVHRTELTAAHVGA
jgi:hypothetical protein